jgi:hypothetical protein
VYLSFHLPEDSDIEWDARFLPICNHGCNLFSLIDCRTPSAEIVSFDSYALEREGFGFEQWMEKWVNGTLR